MPAIRQIEITDTNINFTDSKAGVKKTLSYVNISKGMNTVAKLEDYINTWLATNKQPDYQMVCHVFSVNPLVATLGTFNSDFSIPLNWWQDNG